MHYFFFDIDGTLTDRRTGEIVPSALKAIRLLEAKGHFVAICTGRAYYKTKDFARLCGIQNLVSNGGAALIIDGICVRNAPIDREKALALLDEAHEKGYGALIAVDDSIDVVMTDTLFIKQAGLRQEPTHYLYRPRLDPASLKDIYKIYLSIPEDEEDQMMTINTLGHIRFVPEYLIYQHDEKDQGIMDMMDYLDGRLEDVVVFGDGENDLIMFQKPWLSIAMGDGYQPLKEKADYVTAAAHEDGILKACLHFGWIKADEL